MGGWKKKQEIKTTRDMRYRNTKVRKLHSMVCSLLLILTVFCFGCQDDDLAQGEVSTDAITFSLYSNDEDASCSPSTRTADKPIVLVSEDGTDSLAFYLTITDTIDLGESANQAETAITRGTPITDANIASKCSGKIAIKAFYQDKDFFKDVIEFTNGDTHTSSTHYWPAGEVAFWSYHPKEIAEATDADFNITNEDSPSLSFHYDQKSKLNDVTLQEDLFFAYVKQGKEEGTVSLQYIHALSAVKFCVGQALESIITEISLENIHDGGILTYTPNKNEKLGWKLDSDKSQLKQEFSHPVDENLTGKPSQAITSDDAGTTFLLIPQEIKQNQLSITIQRPGEKAVTYNAQMPAVTWEMGKTYTYTLKLMDGLDIEASSGTVENRVINGIEIKNIYNKPCYIRAMIIANWVDEDGNVAALFNPADADNQNIIDLTIKESNNNYELGQNWSDYWLYDETNNIYYYKAPLGKDATTQVKLFDKFTSPLDRSGEDLKLDFTVLIQAIEAEAGKTSVAAAWGPTIANQLQTLNN